VNELARANSRSKVLPKKGALAIMENDFILTFLSSLGGAAAVAIGLSSWLGKVWAGRILAEDKAKFSEDFARLESKLKLQLDFAKWPMTREDALAANFREALERFLLPIMSAAHSICWLTWLAVEAPEELTVERLKIYEAELHEYLPQISSSLTLLSAHDKGTYDHLKTRAKDIYVLDADTAIATRRLLAARSDGESERDFLVELRRCHEESGELELGLPDQVAGLVHDVDGRRADKVRARIST
jgi:hypothetical protein